VKIDTLDVSAYTVPTASPESDGTLEWTHTTMVIVEAASDGTRSLGYSYADVSTARLVDCVLKPAVLGKDPFDIAVAWEAMVASIRNLGRPGISSMAISAVDNALWDLKARLLNTSVAGLLGRAHESIPAYGSGGFTSYSIDQLKDQLSQWVARGMRSVKMKIGRDPDRDTARVRAAREAIGWDVGLFVDANGAYSRKQALEKAEQFTDLRVTWFEEPVSSDDLDGLRLLRDHTTRGMVIAAGEYGYDAHYFRSMLESGAVDVLQADATRCAGITGFRDAGALALAFSTPFSAHTAPSIHAHAACAVPRAINVEYFFDHARIEKMFFDGAIEPIEGELRPDPSRPGFGLELKRPDIEKYKVYGNHHA